MNNPEARRFLIKNCKGKALIEVKLVDRLLKYMQNWVYVPKHKLRLLKKYHSFIVGHKDKKNPP